MSGIDDLKRQAAVHTVELEVRSGMALGLGTGSTAAHVLDALAERLRDGRLVGIRAVPTSNWTAGRCEALGIPLTTLAECPRLDVTIDGADEIDPSLSLIKGRGGALLHEKVVATAAVRMVVVADDSKLVPRLGTRAPLPVEVIPFALPLCQLLLADQGWAPTLRTGADGSPFVTDEGNVILDCRRDEWSDLASLAAAIEATPGVAGHGLFLGIAAVAVVATESGARVVALPLAVAIPRRVPRLGPRATDRYPHANQDESLGRRGRLTELDRGITAPHSRRPQAARQRSYAATIPPTAAAT